jgi:hypothetical protein
LRRPFSVGHSQISLLQRLAVERAKIARNRRANPFARTEALLSANIERKLRFQRLLVLLQKPDESAKVVIMAMTEHEGIQLAWVNSQQTGVVVEGLRSETKIH